jgi:glycosyltransferase involved in cell wall biosynthesis
VFPAATVARKGVYELRRAARELGLRLTLAGAQLEGPDFWQGVEVERAAGRDWLEGARAVVLPSFVEHAPRRLLEAVARGVPVVASTACGLDGLAGVVSVPAGDADALREALARVLQPAGDNLAVFASADVGSAPFASGLI